MGVVAYVVDEHGAIIKDACKAMTLPGESECTAVDQANVSTALASKELLPEESYSHGTGTMAPGRLPSAMVVGANEGEESR